MTTAVSYTLLGTRPTSEPGWFDACDIAVELSDGSMVCVGVRSPESLNETAEAGWGSYQPIPVTIDFSTVDHYDFGALFWLGPEPKPCVIWTNAVALNTAGVATLLREDTATPASSSILAGRDGEGLPTPAELGIEIPNDAAWVRLD